jgi:hypothetical protein
VIARFHHGLSALRSFIDVESAFKEDLEILVNELVERLVHGGALHANQPPPPSSNGNQSGEPWPSQRNRVYGMTAQMFGEW